MQGKAGGVTVFLCRCALPQPASTTLVSPHSPLPTPLVTTLVSGLISLAWYMKSFNWKVGAMLPAGGSVAVQEPDGSLSSLTSGHVSLPGFLSSLQDQGPLSRSSLSHTCAKGIVPGALFQSSEPVLSTKICIFCYT